MRRREFITLVERRHRRAAGEFGGFSSMLKPFRFLKLYFHALVISVFVFAGGFLRRRHRALLYIIRNHFSAAQPISNHLEPAERPDPLGRVA
jgi:hypothetical protein